MEEKQLAQDLIDFINASPSTYHVVRNIKAALLRKGYQELQSTEKWKLEKEGRYFVSQNDTALFAFVVGSGELASNGFRIIAAHTDSPTLKIKPNPEILVDNSYLKLNVEIYGGPILNTWFDRPLSIAGRVQVQTNNPFKPETKYLVFKKPILIIPNLAYHFNRAVNDGVKIHKQNHTSPIMATIESVLEKDNYLLKLISQEINVEIEEIIDFDLTLYEYEKGSIIGSKDEFISSSKVDNLSMIHAGFEGLFTSTYSDTTQIMACFDNEEIGSQTKQGAGSPILKNILERIVNQFHNTQEDYIRAIHNSFMISADNAHALHPNYQEVHDPTNHPIINRGPVIKYNANQKYTSDSYSGAIFEMLAKKAKSPIQRFVNRSNEPGGATLGSIATSQLEIKSVDVGNPMLAMHSIRELCGVKDHFNIKNIFREFYSNSK